jgi:hypothetical protein
MDEPTDQERPPGVHTGHNVGPPPVTGLHHARNALDAIDAL